MAEPRRSGFSRALAVRALAVLAALAGFLLQAPPAHAQQAAKRHVSTEAITIPEARAMMGYPPSAVDKVLGGVDQIRVAILDNGFAGIEEHLKANPKEAKITHLAGIDPAKSGDHGFKVYLVARQVLGDAEIFLYDDSLFTDRAALARDMKQRGVHIVNYSRGVIQFPFEKGDSATIALVRHLIEAMAKEQIFLFVAAGNSAREVHTEEMPRRSGNSFALPGLTLPLRSADGGTTEALMVRPGKDGTLALEFYWDNRIRAMPPFLIEVRGKDGALLGKLFARGQKQLFEAETLGKTRYNMQSSEAAIILGSMFRFEGKNLPDELFQIVLRSVDNEPSGPIRVHRRSGRGVGYYNGSGSNSLNTSYEHPFVTSIGAISIGSDGQPAPTSFTSWGTTREGTRVPHAYGPGALKLGGDTIHGTSYAAPFLTAMLAAGSFGYNPKDILQLVSENTSFSPLVSEETRGEFGIPTMVKLFPNELRKLTGETRASDWSLRRDGKGLHVEVDFTRCCMSGMTYRAVLELVRLKKGNDGRQTVERIADPRTGQSVHAIVHKRGAREAKPERLSFTIATEALPTTPGEYALQLGYFITAWGRPGLQSVRNGGLLRLN